MATEQLSGTQLRTPDVERKSPAIRATYRPSRGLRMMLRAAQARVVLERVQDADRAGTSQAAPYIARATWLKPPDNLTVSRLYAQVFLLILVALVLIGESFGAVSSRVAHSPVISSAFAAASPAQSAGLGAPIVPLPVAPLQIASLNHEPLAPALQRPIEIATAFQTSHPLAANETLGEVAQHYGISLDSLVWANGLERGDALMEGQILRIPRVSGLTHVVASGETVIALAERFGVAPEAITTFAPNGVGADQQLQPGTEIFIPGGRNGLPDDWLGSVGGIAGLAQRTAEPAGVIYQTQTNMRTGPSTEHPRVTQLEAGRQVALVARHQDWLQVRLGPQQGWVRADMLQAQPAFVAALPETTDFPPPPPRWVWPARGTISSRFGPRWGGFHNGLDIANRAWTPIVAARTGRVTEAGWCRGYGYCVKLSHDGAVETIYGHLITQPVVAAGDEVDAGELIGHMGSTYDRAGGGYSTGVHLHFTINVNGRAVDPLRFLP